MKPQSCRSLYLNMQLSNRENRSRPSLDDVTAVTGQTRVPTRITTRDIRQRQQELVPIGVLRFSRENLCVELVDASLLTSNLATSVWLNRKTTLASAPTFFTEHLKRASSSTWARVSPSRSRVNPPTKASVVESVANDPEDVALRCFRASKAKSIASYNNIYRQHLQTMVIHTPEESAELLRQQHSSHIPTRHDDVTRTGIYLPVTIHPVPCLKRREGERERGERERGREGERERGREGERERGRGLG
ncbi:hypothetical protein C0Q70_20995 [Pomacea canaliculata]|uniref:Uncharacterized protein n=1 Tax=Pomacea canaliculata TaxID=400727 RepID=A0A2T7NB95_POMCA|nr:hypothetical protein C0Q70_20995 [Pomacea canaliculata]